MKILIRFLLGAIFLISGASKAVDTQTFIGLIQAYDIGFLAYLAIIIPPLEIILGLCFWFNIEIKISALIMMISTAFFSLIFLEVFFTKGIQDCGCFGSIKFLQMPPWATVVRNILIITGAWYLYKYPPGQKPGYRTTKLAVICIVALAAFTVSAVSYSHPLINVSKINNQDLKGKFVQNTFLKDYKTFDPKKTYAVFIFSPDCYHCWDMTNNVKTLTESGYVDETIAFTPAELMPSQLIYQQTLKPNFKIFFLTAAKMANVTTSYPVLMIIKNNQVIEYNATGVIHSGFTIKRFMH